MLNPKFLNAAEWSAFLFWSKSNQSSQILNFVCNDETMKSLLSIYADDDDGSLRIVY